MIISSLSRAALVSAALVALSLPAAAQTDVSSAPALGKTPYGHASKAPLKPAAAPAKTLGPTVPADVWNKVFQVALREGKREAVANTPGFSYSYSEGFTTPGTDEDDPLTVKQGFNFLAVPVANGQVKAVAAQFFYIEGTYDPKKKLTTTKESVFEANGVGQLRSATHSTYTQVSGEPEKAGKPVNLDLAAPATKDEFELMLRWWTKEEP